MRGDHRRETDADPAAGEVVLVTGAAGGICLRLAEELAGRGRRLVLLDADAGALAAAVERLGPAVVAAWAVDARDERAVRDAFARLPAAQRPAVLVNGVGGDARRIPLGELELEDVRASLEHNLLTACLLTQLCVPAMRERGAGRIVFLASIAGRSYSVFSNAAYVAAKAAVVGFMKQCAWELAPYGITANAVAHGPVATERIERAWAAKSEAERERILRAIPLGRRCEVDEAVHFVLPFCLGPNGYATGAVLDVNGGMLV